MNWSPIPCTVFKRNLITFVIKSCVALVRNHMTDFKTLKNTLRLVKKLIVHYLTEGENERLL